MNEEDIKKLYTLRRPKEWVLSQYVRVIEDESTPPQIRIRALEKYAKLKALQPMKVRKHGGGKPKKLEDKQAQTELASRLSKFMEVPNGHSQ